MKRTVALLVALMLLMPAALADDMTVVNCEEWVSLRERPDKSSARLAKVPLYETVTDCERAENGFVRCDYQGLAGYILEEYLEPVEMSASKVFLDARADGLRVTASRAYEGGGETLYVSVLEKGGELWGTELHCADATELTMTDAFIGGTAKTPRLMLYAAGYGLECRDLRTGAALWTLRPAAVNLGASLSHAVDNDGTMYITGYYGPDPVCVDAEGRVLWQASAGSDDIIWPYNVAVTDEGVAVDYEIMSYDPACSGQVIYDKADGHVIRVTPDGIG